MFRTKKDVDHHVQDIFRKLHNENERTVRCFKIAELYHYVGDNDSARRYLSRYMNHFKESKAFKLMGQILEVLGQKDDALVHYKNAFELDRKQDELILRICNLMADPDVEVDVNYSKYWVELAEKNFPGSKVIFQLKERILSFEKHTNSEEDLESLILTELGTRPSDVKLRIKLLAYYMEKNRFETAYQYASDIEYSCIHRDCIMWYKILCELLSKVKNSRQQNWSFWVLYISSLERFVALSIKEQSNFDENSLALINILYDFDRCLLEAREKNFLCSPTLTENIFSHMWGQLNFHMACILMQRIKREQSNFLEVIKQSSPLFLTSLHVKPIDLNASWISDVEHSLRKQLQVWFREGSYRCSQAGHIMYGFADGNQKKFLNNIEKFCAGAWRERLYKRVFVGQFYQKIKSSYFVNNDRKASPLCRLITFKELTKYDEDAEKVWPHSLHHQIWPAIMMHNYKSFKSDSEEILHPNISSHLFPDLKLSIESFSPPSAATLCRLDVDAFLNAAVLCASAEIKKRQCHNISNSEAWQFSPADLTTRLCSKEQEKWWADAYKIYCKESFFCAEDIRKNLQYGLETIRCFGNHGLHPIIVVHLARIFKYRAQQLKDKNSESSDIEKLESRSELYWSAALTLLENIENNRTSFSSSKNLFSYKGSDMTKSEQKNVIEEAKLFMAQKFTKNYMYEQAIEILELLKSPEASFEQGKIYKKLGDQMLSSLPKENVTSEMRSQHIIILSKARNCFYLTLDRLRSPEADPKHPLNAELSTYITFVENELKRIDPDIVHNRNKNDFDNFSDESYSSIPSENYIVNSNLSCKNKSINLQTPAKNARRNHRQPSHCTYHSELLDPAHNECRPSPERLDAQIRQLIHSFESLKQQNHVYYTSVAKKLDQIIKLNSHSSIQESVPDHRPSVPNSTEETWRFKPNSYNEFSGNVTFDGTRPVNVCQTTPLPHESFYQRCQPFSSIMYSPSATVTALQSYYHNNSYNQSESSVIPSLDDKQKANLYPESRSSPIFAEGYEESSISLQKNTNDFLQKHKISFQGNQNHSTNLQQQFVNFSVNERLQNLNSYNTAENTLLEPHQNIIIQKNLDSTKVAPRNVVITSSDTLPSATGSNQPILSVNIPIQHKLSTLSTENIDEDLKAPHHYQISMPYVPSLPYTFDRSLTEVSTDLSCFVKSSDHQNLLETHLSENVCDSDSNENEHDPLPDFTPIIPLPEEVPVKTGEENEETLFCSRAKLYRYIDRQWKERGIGNVKLLKDVNGKVRLLMRREQVLKICANHMLTKDMELVSMPNTDKAFMWVANDFADEEIKLEKLCIKFKTSDEANAFKDKFNEVKNNLPQKISTQDTKFLDKRLITCPKECLSTSSCNIKTKEYGSDLVQCNLNDRLVDKPLLSDHIFNDIKNFSQYDNSNLSTFNNKANYTEETETILMESKLTFSQYCSKTKIWKKKDQGTLKIFLLPSIGRLRFLITSEGKKQEQIDQIILPSTIFEYEKKNIKWSLKVDDDYYNVYSIEFYDSDQTLIFQNLLDQYLPKTSKSTAQPESVLKPLSELFKPESGSWECRDCYTRNNKKSTKCVSCEAPVKTVSILPAPPLVKDVYENLKPLAGSWECQACYVINTPSNIYCVACNGPKDAFLPVATKTDTLQSSSSTFSFGILETKKFDVESKTSNNHISVSSGSAFKLNSNTSNISSNSFDTIKLLENSTKSKEGFTFGSPGKSFHFQFQAKSLFDKTFEQVENSDDEKVEEFDDVYFTPLIPLPEKIDPITGEENESILFSHRAKLFKYDKIMKEWKERGLGDIKLLKHMKTGKLRLIMRREQVLKLCLNHTIDETFDMSAKDDKTWIWSAGDFSDGEVEFLSLACRFKTFEIANEFKKAIDNACTDNLNEISATPINNKEIKSEEPIDIQIIYELKVNYEDKLAAKKLKLPDNFYSYKEKPVCPGCIGCEEQEILLYNDEPLSLSSSNNFGSLKKNSNTSQNLDSINISKNKTKLDSGEMYVIPERNNTMLDEKSDSQTFENKAINFLPIQNSLSFSALAVQTSIDQTPAFKTDPNFKFDGAGTSVFNSKINNQKSFKIQDKDEEPTTNLEKKEKKNDSKDSEEYDPYYEPIIPLPDTVEIKTGEEDEEKLFCQRAKLYRYDQSIKEWKERGTGEMKLLHHLSHGTYRLLLRREQVHKVVCNILLTNEIELHSLNSSDRAWMWAGMNYAEPERAEIEQLAVRFKTQQLALQFKEAIDLAQRDLTQKHK